VKEPAGARKKTLHAARKGGEHEISSEKGAEVPAHLLQESTSFAEGTSKPPGSSREEGLPTFACHEKKKGKIDRFGKEEIVPLEGR